ncbi:unnamed protein product [Vicia faba]|uniref:Uncharacterized protein n=1 Tax=Vicia faba TaxID=3906 RepID=A0AAV1A531_VICFA|nr:unnamed protein product [Vicia faba]
MASIWWSHNIYSCSNRLACHSQTPISFLFYFHHYHPFPSKYNSIFPNHIHTTYPLEPTTKLVLCHTPTTTKTSQYITHLIFCHSTCLLQLHTPIITTQHNSHSKPCSFSLGYCPFMVWLDVVTKSITFKDVEHGDVQFDVGNLFFNKHEFVIREHMFQWARQSLSN